MPIIVIEGVNGSGTSTQSKRLASYLENKGKKAILTSHPGSTDLGKELRKILKYGDVKTTPEQELMLFAADFMSFYQEIVMNIDIDNDYLICDRLNITGALTYQKAGGSSDFQVSSLLTLLENLGWQIKIDYLFVISVSYDIIRTRLEKPNLVDQDKNNGDKKDRFESRGKNYLETVCSYYDCLNDSRIISDYFNEIVKLDGSRSEDDVFNQIISKLD